ncbi:hypothetical protein [Allosalinactinospora lopnorensis]|uniref:hypothetical protein n=1 Tax=Allosalinactinospora lopnorensis TaxID=1352348 RepID=UPI000695AD31|nr:hypothetical protein [Allosalinactinospora lopnorensis]
MWAEGGFGLAVIVDQVTGGQWGVEMFPDGKAVWARLSHPPVGSHPTAEEEAPWPQRRLTAHRTSDWGGSRPQ